MKSLLDTITDRITKVANLEKREGTEKVYFVRELNCILCDKRFSRDFFITTFNNDSHECFITFICPECSGEKIERKLPFVYDRIECLHERGETVELSNQEEV